MLIWILLLIAQICIASPKLFVVQTLDESAAVIDVGSGAVNAQALSLGTLPNDIIVYKNRVYAANSGYNSIQEIDAETETTLREIQVSGGVNVWSMAMLNDDTMAATCLLSNNVVVIRMSDEQIIGTLNTGVAPQSIIVHGDHFLVGVTGVEYPTFGPASVFVFNKHTLERVDSISVDINPQSLAVDEFNRLHVVCTGDYGSRSGKVNVIDLDSRQVVSEFDVGGAPTNISIGGGIVYLAAGGWGNEGYVYSYRTADLAVEHDSDNPLLVGSGAFDVEVFSDGSFLVSCFNEDIVEYRDTEGELIETFLLSDGPAHMALYEEVQAVSEGMGFIPEQIVLADPYPNPFNGVVKLDLYTPLNSPAKVYIYNIVGQAVQTLDIPAGETGTIWDGRDKAGISVSSGVYIVSLITKREIHSKRLILMK